MSDDADVSACCEVTDKLSTEVHSPLNVQRALAMRSMSNEELVHKLRQCYPSLQKIKEKKVNLLSRIVYTIIAIVVNIHYTD